MTVTMTMTDAYLAASSCAAGAALGATFFLGLWWTVRKSVFSTRPALWFLCSLLLRTGAVMTGFYAMSAGRWERLLWCLLGFTLARLGVKSWLDLVQRRSADSVAETGRAP